MARRGEASGMRCAGSPVTPFPDASPLLRGTQRGASHPYTQARSAVRLPRADRDDLSIPPVSYTHLRAHETVLDLVCRLLLEKKKPKTKTKPLFIY